VSPQAHLDRPLDLAGAPTTARPRGLVEAMRALQASVEHCIDTVDDLARGAERTSATPTPKRLELLRWLLQRGDDAIVPCPDPRAPLGHSIEEVDRLLGVAPGFGLGTLEELADLGLLARSLENVVHACASCGTWQINFRETCPACRSIDLDSERCLVHFACAYVGLESEFLSDGALVCPKCRATLSQLGADFERPSDVLVCRACHESFESPLLEAQCLACGWSAEAREAEPTRVHRYLTTARATRAVELERLTGLELDDLTLDPELGTETWEYLILEVSREVERAHTQRTSFAVAHLALEAGGRTYPYFREWPAETARGLCDALSATRLPLEVAARADEARLAFLLPGIGGEELGGLRERRLAVLASLALAPGEGQPLVPVWTDAAFDGTSALDEVLSFFVRGVAR
jgi:hypothetical protein